VPLGLLQGICLCAIDIDQSWGKGLEIRCPAAALMMAVSGRTALLHLLEGPGLPLLQRRAMCAHAMDVWSPWLQVATSAATAIAAYTPHNSLRDKGIVP
jgi:hypothetical protein